MYNKRKLILSGIYGLYDPNDGLIKYIGSSTNIYQRFISHITNRNRYTNDYAVWLQNLLANNQKPKLIILQECDKLDFPDLETFYMFRYKTSLLNQVTIVKNYNKYGVYCKNIHSDATVFFKNLKEAAIAGFDSKQIGFLISRKRPTLKGYLFWMGNEQEPNYKKRKINQEKKTTKPKNYRKYYYKGKEYGLYEIARLYNIKPYTLKSRIDSGWSIERALKSPVRQIDKRCKAE